MVKLVNETVPEALHAWVTARRKSHLDYINDHDTIERAAAQTNTSRFSIALKAAKARAPSIHGPPK